jgi:hypothetical protein
MDALELDDTGVIDVDNEIVNNDTAAKADIRTDDGVKNIMLEDGVHPQSAANVNELAGSLRQLASPQDQLVSPHLLTGALSSYHYIGSVSLTIVQNSATSYTFIADISQVLSSLPCRMVSPIF